jgi:hypothetical protein
MTKKLLWAKKKKKKNHLQPFGLFNVLLVVKTKHLVH